MSRKQTPLHKIGDFFGDLIFICFIFICFIITVIFLPGKDKDNTKTERQKARYLDRIREIFGEDMATCFSVGEYKSKSALISYQTNFATFGHRDPSIKPKYIEYKEWHKITDNIYIFIKDQMSGSICSFCFDISCSFFRSEMYLDKEEMRNSYFKEILSTQTGWNLPDEAFVVGYIDYSTLQLAPEVVYLCLSECNFEEIKNQLDTLVSSTEEWSKDDNTYHFSKSEGNESGVTIDYTVGNPFLEVVHFMM